MSKLIQPEGGCWNEQALEQNLVHFDAHAVRCIPLGRGCEDFWAWEGERHGIYTARLAYRFLVEKEAQERNFKSGQADHSTGNNNPVWHKLWKTKVPPKVRVFWWRFRMSSYHPGQISATDILRDSATVNYVGQPKRLLSMC